MLNISLPVFVEAVARATVILASTGLVAYRTSGGGQRQLAWVDRAGTARGTLGDPGVERGALTLGELSGEVPDQHRVDAFREHARRCLLIEGST